MAICGFIAFLCLFSGCDGLGKAPATPRGRTSDGRNSDAKLEKLRDFALAESPVIWDAYERLCAEIAVQSGKVESLRRELIVFGRNPSLDTDYAGFVAQVEVLKRQRSAILSKLADAFVEKAKLEAMVGHEESEKTWRGMLEDGMTEAEAVMRRFRDLRKEK